MYPKIYGINPSSEAGVDDFAVSVFLGGCNFKCPYCMNAPLVKIGDLREYSIYEVEDVVKLLSPKYVMISGGEPTLQNSYELENLIAQVKRWGCKVGLSTNGSNPSQLRDVLPSLDYVALDIKTSEEKYPLISDAGTYKKVVSSLSSIHMKMSVHSKSVFDYEVRTTLFPPLVGEKEIIEIAERFYFMSKWTLQPFRNNGKCLSPEAKNERAYTRDEIDKLHKIANYKIIDVNVREV